MAEKTRWAEWPNSAPLSYGFMECELEGNLEVMAFTSTLILLHGGRCVLGDFVKDLVELLMYKISRLHPQPLLFLSVSSHSTQSPV